MLSTKTHISGFEFDYCLMNEEGVAYTNVEDFEEVKLGDDEYYVMGDNRPYSKDSRYVGPVKKSQIFAKKMLVLLPISDIGVKD